MAPSASSARARPNRSPTASCRVTASSSAAVPSRTSPRAAATRPRQRVAWARTQSSSSRVASASHASSSATASSTRPSSSSASTCSARHQYMPGDRMPDSAPESRPRPRNARTASAGLPVPGRDEPEHPLLARDDVRLASRERPTALGELPARARSSPRWAATRATTQMRERILAVVGRVQPAISRCRSACSAASASRPPSSSTRLRYQRAVASADLVTQAQLGAEPFEQHPWHDRAAPTTMSTCARPERTPRRVARADRRPPRASKACSASSSASGAPALKSRQLKARERARAQAVVAHSLCEPERRHERALRPLPRPSMFRTLPQARRESTPAGRGPSSASRERLPPQRDCPLGRAGVFDVAESHQHVGPLPRRERPLRQKLAPPRPAHGSRRRRAGGGGRP